MKYLVIVLINKVTYMKLIWLQKPYISFTYIIYITYGYKVNLREARWPSGRASDSGARGRGFDPHAFRRVVSLNKIHLTPKKY